MNELLAAITTLINTGSALAWPALIGFFVVKALESLILPATFSIVAFTVIKVTKLVWEGMLKEAGFKEEAYRNRDR